MKLRFGFVSNSSSASFAVPLDVLTPELVTKIKDYQNTLLEMTYSKNHRADGKGLWDSCRYYKDQIEGLDETAWVNDCWDIWETETELRGDTSMDNLYFDEFLIRLGVPKDKITYERD